MKSTARNLFHLQIDRDKQRARGYRGCPPAFYQDHYPHKTQLDEAGSSDAPSLVCAAAGDEKDGRSEQDREASYGVHGRQVHMFQHDWTSPTSGISAGFHDGR